MIEIFETAKRAILGAEFMVGELNDPYDVENYTSFEQDSEVIVFGHAYSNKMGKMYAVYSPEAEEATTVHEMFLNFIEEEGEEEIE